MALRTQQSAVAQCCCVSVLVLVLLVILLLVDGAAAAVAAEFVQISYNTTTSYSTHITTASKYFVSLFSELLTSNTKSHCQNEIDTPQ
jgi:hypothetical protein